MNRQRVLGIGETVMDILFKNDQPQKAVPGGSTFNSIVSLGRAGVPCAMVTEVGGDHVGDLICDYLHDNGVSAFYPEAHVKTINKKLDDLTQNDIVCDSSIPTLHIMADVLESQDVDLERLAQLVNDSLKGLNQFICVQLYFGNYKEDNRVRKFASFFTKNARFGSVPQRDMELEYRDYPMLKGTACAYAAFGDFDM